MTPVIVLTVRRFVKTTCLLTKTTCVNARLARYGTITGSEQWTRHGRASYWP